MGRRVSAVLVAGAALCCGERTRPAAAPTSPHRNLVLITLDTVRADHLGCYGDRGASTPALDRLAAEGVRFAAADSAVPLTLPSHATILSGLLPARHGVHQNGQNAFPAEPATLATVLSAAGYATGAFVGAFVLDRRFGLGRGFDTYDDEIAHGPEGAPLEAERSAERVVDRALAWLRQERDRPFFVWVHLYDAHFPYAPPEPYRSRFASAPYDGELAWVDAQVERLLGSLAESGRDRNTLVLVAGDHGEGLGDHGERAHGLLLYESTLRVPLLMRLPGALPAGGVVGQAVGLVDLAPTALALLAQPLPPNLDGRDLSPALLAGREPDPRPVLSETRYPESFGWLGLASVRSADLKLIRGARSELYDLAGDPAESRDVAAERRAETAALERPLSHYLKIPERPAARLPDEETRSRLSSLGYVTSTAERPAAIDPRDRLGAFGLFEEAGWERAAGRPEAALAKLRRALAGDPRNGLFLGTLAQVERDLGRLGEAVRDYRRAITVRPADARLWTDLAAALREGGTPVEAERAAAEAARLDPRSSEAVNLLGICAAERGDARSARQRFERATRLEPRSATAWNNLGNAERSLGRLAEAAAAYARAAALAPGWADPLNGLGVVEIEEGRPRDAIAYFDRALELQPEFAEARRNRALARERR